MSTQADWLTDATQRAKARRDTSIARVGNTVGERWISEAAEYIRLFAGARGTPFLVEDVVERWTAAAMPPPHDGRAWGAAARRAKDLGWIQRVGYAPAKSSNLSPKVLWRAVA